MNISSIQGKLCELSYNYAVDFVRFAGFFVESNYDSAEKAGVSGRSEPLGHMKTVSIYHGADVRTQTRYLGSCHSCISNICSTAAEYDLIRGLNVGMSADYSGNSVSEVVAHSLFLGSGLSVEVHKDIFTVSIFEYLVYCSSFLVIQFFIIQNFLLVCHLVTYVIAKAVFS